MNKKKIPLVFKVMNRSKYLPSFQEFIPTPSLDPHPQKENKEMIPHPTSHRFSLCSHGATQGGLKALLPLRVVSQATAQPEVVSKGPDFVSAATMQPRGREGFLTS
jgi:hypothetical protein